ncbi:MAG TPA: hypothetical protein VKW08_22350 [Xanthobacteraceae bacterium]|nr:hypothetical protein [Xanthobacteraceae bacterium]
MFRSWHAMGMSTGLGLILLHCNPANAEPRAYVYAPSPGPEQRWYATNAVDPQHRFAHSAQHHTQHLHRFAVARHERGSGRDTVKDERESRTLSSLKKEMIDLRRQVDAVESMRQELTDLKEKIWGPTPLQLSLSVLPRPQSMASVEPKPVTLKLPDLSLPERPRAPVNPATASLPAVIEERSGPNAKARSAVEEAKAYLIDTATPGYTMLRQGVPVAIGRLHPDFIVKLAEAVRLARAHGLGNAGVYSAYRPPIFGVGGFSDKFNSLHSYGLAADMAGIGTAGSKAAKVWQSIVAKVGLYLPYGPNNHIEFNHTQLVPTKIAPSFLRGTITASAPKDLHRMWMASGIKAHVDDNERAVTPPSLASATDTDKQVPLPQVPERRAMPRARQARPSRRRNPPRQRMAEPQVAGTRRRSARAGRNLAWMHWVLRPF